MTNKGTPISTQNVIINILVCRLQLGIDRDHTTVNLLQIFRPGMINLLTHAKKSGAAKGMDLDQLLLDMQSTAIEYLIKDYKIGDRGRATPYLFDIHQGFLTKWIKWITSKHRRFYAHHELYDPIDVGGGDASDDENQHMHSGIERANPEGGWAAIMQGSDSTKYDPYVETEADSNHLSQEVGEIIEDGKTLTSNEYRVIKFCLTNSNELNKTRHIDGLHIYLAQIMGVSRPRITRLFKRAKEKIKKHYLAIEQSDD